MMSSTVTPFRLRVEGRHHAVAQHRMGQRDDVVDRHVEAPVEQGAHLAPEDQIAGRPAARPPSRSSRFTKSHASASFGRVARTRSST